MPFSKYDYLIKYLAMNIISNPESLKNIDTCYREYFKMELIIFT